MLGWIGRCPTSAPCVVNCPAGDLQRKSAERGQRTLSVAIPYKASAGPLHLLVDGTSIKAEGEGEWNVRKHGGSKRRLWRTILIGIDEETLEIRAIEVTSSGIGDAPMLPDLLNHISPDQDLGSVTAPSHACKHALPDSGWCLRHAQMP